MNKLDGKEIHQLNSNLKGNHPTLLLKEENLTSVEFICHDVEDSSRNPIGILKCDVSR
jgi:hypothetical protein